MKRMMVGLTVLAVLAGCRNDRGRDVALADSLQHRLDVPRDTAAPTPLPDSTPPSRVEATTSPAPQPAPSRTTAPAKQTAGARLARGPASRREASERAEPPAGYAPPARDTAAPTLPSAASDTGSDGRTSGTISPEETATASTSEPAREPAPAPQAASNAHPDTAPARPAAVDTARIPSVADRTEAAPAPDSTARADTSAASTAPATTAPAPGSDTVAADAGRLPAGTEIRATLEDSLDSRRNTAGQQVTATVVGDVRAPAGRVLIPSGSLVWLSVQRLSPARSRSAKDGELEFRVDSIAASGHAAPVSATVRPVPHELVGRGVSAGEAEKVAAGAAVGAVAGRVIGGNTKGAVIGGVVGAAGGTAVAVQTASRDVVVKAGTPLVLVLTTPLTP